MAIESNIIKIKRSGTSGAPASLKLGELAYSYLTASGNPTSNGGDRLFIGANGVNGGTGNANDVIVIGGKYFTDLLDHERGILTASSALVVDGNKKLDELLVDNLSLNGSTLGSTADLKINTVNGIELNGTVNKIVSGPYAGTSVDFASYELILRQDRGGGISLKVGADGTVTSTLVLNNDGSLTVPGTIKTLNNADLILTPNGTGKSIITNIYTDASTSLLEYIQDATGGQVVAGEGIDVTYDDTAGTVTVSGEDASSANKGIASFSPTYFTVTAGDVAINDATSSTKGIASFNATDFTVTTGAVTVNAERIQDIVGGMIDSNTESGISVTYDDTNGKLDFNVSDPVITIAGDVDGFATMTNLGDTTITVTLDTVNTAVGTYGSSTSIPVITVNGKGLITGVTTQSISTTLNIAGNTGTDGVALGSDTLTITGTGAISTAVTDNQVAISVATATSSVLGVATFNTASFAVTSGDVTIKSAGVSNAQLANSSFYIGTTTVSLGAASGSITSLAVDISGKATTAGTADKVANSVTFAATGGATAGATFDGSAAKTVDYSTIGAAPAAGSSSIVTVGALTSGSIGVGFTAIPNTALANSSVTVGSTSISLGATSTSLTGLTQIDVDNITINGNEISSTDTNGNISLNPNGTGTVAVNSSRITGLADPTDAQDAATKAYVDARSAGLDPKASVRAATTANIILSNTQTVDGVALAVGNRVLVKDQTTASENGIYIVASGAWARSSDMDEPAEMTSGVFFFVEEGTANADAGFVITTDGGTIVVGTDAVNFTQFSGAGQLVAGDGLSKTGNTLAVNVAASGGIEISADALQLKSTVAGDGLTYTNGVLDIVGTADRISVSSNAVDIASTYVGQSSITTLGTIATGTWQATTIASAYGGTGFTTYAKGDFLYASATNTLSKLTAGTNGQTLQLQDGVPYWGDLDGGSY